MLFWVFIAYAVCVVLLIRFFQVVRMWDEEIEAMVHFPKQHGKERAAHLKHAA